MGYHLICVDVCSADVNPLYPEFFMKHKYQFVSFIISLRRNSMSQVVKIIPQELPMCILYAMVADDLAIQGINSKATDTVTVCPESPSAAPL